MILITSIHYLLLICLFYISIQDNHENLLNSSKILNCIIVCVTCCIMLYLDLYNDFSTIFPLYTLCIRLFLVSLIILNSSKSNYVIVIIFVMVARFIIYDNYVRNTYIYGILILFTTFTILIKPLKITTIYKWYISISFVLCFALLYLFFINMAFNEIIELIILTFSIVAVTFVLNLVSLKRNNKITLMLNHNYDFERIYQKFIHNYCEFNVLLIEIKGLKRYKGLVNFKEYNFTIFEIGKLINSKIENRIEFCVLKKDLYCLFINDNNFDTSIFKQELNQVINTSIKKDFHLVLDFKLMNEKDLINFYNPQYQLS